MPSSDWFWIRSNLEHDIWFLGFSKLGLWNFQKYVLSINVTGKLQRRSYNDVMLKLDFFFLQRGKEIAHKNGCFPCKKPELTHILFWTSRKAIFKNAAEKAPLRLVHVFSRYFLHSNIFDNSKFFHLITK